MAVPYHTHTFEIPAATKAEIEAGVRDDVTATPASLGSAATKDVAYFATASQGGSADTAVQSVNGKTGKEISLTKADIDLASVDDTSDLNKPISTAQQAEFNLKADTSALGSAAYEDATVFASASQGAKADSAVQSINGKTGAAITLAKSDIGLGSVDNTADLNKPISTATQTALNSKATTDQGAKADSALQAAGGTTGQVLVKNSDVVNDVVWATSEAATAVSYAPQTLTTAQKIQARENIDVQPVTTTTVGAAIAGANGKQTPADGDFFTGVEVGGSTMFKTTWGNIKSWLKTYFDTLYLNQTGKAADSALLNNQTAAQLPISTATQTALNAKLATTAVAADSAKFGNETPAQWQTKINNSNNANVTDARSTGWVEWSLTTAAGNTAWISTSGYYLCGFTRTATGTGGNTISGLAARQPQIYIPNVGWRALGTW